MDTLLESKLVKFRDKLKKEADSTFDDAGCNDDENESRLELQFSNVLLRLHVEMREIIESERNPKNL